ncbi:2-aminoethylphosphonate-pyruvate transaminase [Oxalobacteraceae bacterium IMCC9480]|nr:2-aminoethylphosphonate-pyruvate transaminase [Oxalobacteraceae bacterium IMCC9480]
MRDPLLLTPGPLTTSLATKTAMLHDWGSWDSSFNVLTADVRRRLLAIVDGADDFSCVPLQGSGTFAVEAAIGTLLPRDGKLLCLINGAYGKRIAQLTEVMGRQVSVLDFGESAPVDPVMLESALARDPAITHVAVVYCETSTGILNPMVAISDIVAAAGKSLIIDAMSAFGALPMPVQMLTYDAVIASGNKCLEGVPGMGFVIVRTAVLEQCAGRAHSLSLDLHAQWRYMEQTGQWRYTPPTHVMAALAVALDQYELEGGQPARLARYEDNCRTLVSGLEALGLRVFLAPDIQAPIIVTVHAPDHPNWNFSTFYALAKARGVVLYPGKLTHAETFRVGCIGAIGSADLLIAVEVIADALRQMEITPQQTALAYRGAVQAVVFDWAGTLVDFGSFAPTQVLIDAFAGFGITVSMTEPRLPMGLAKWDHIQALGRQDGVAQRWQQQHGRAMSDADVDTLYATFLPLQIERVAAYSDPIPGAIDVLATLRARAIRIGSCSGYPRVVMDKLLPHAVSQGIRVDHAVATDDLAAGGRPGPWMALANVLKLGITDVRGCIKIDDTVPGITEGLAAGMWTVGLSLSGNETGLSLAELAALSPAETAVFRDRAAAKLNAAGAHYVIDTIAGLPAIVDAIEARLGRGEQP